MYQLRYEIIDCNPTTASEFVIWRIFFKYADVGLSCTSFGLLGTQQRSEEKHVSETSMSTYRSKRRYNIQDQ
jgi:hypothetical protein